MNTGVVYRCSWPIQRRIWRKYALKPHQIRLFKLSRDPRLVEKIHFGERRVRPVRLSPNICFTTTRTFLFHPTRGLFYFTLTRSMSRDLPKAGAEVSRGPK